MSSSTQTSLLAQLRANDRDPAVWSRFVVHYGPRIRAWAKRVGLQDADADDATQTILTRLLTALRKLDYDPARSFRGYLRTLAEHAAIDILAAQRRSAGESAQPVQELEAPPSLGDQLAEAFDLDLLDAALARVRLRVRPLEWQAFHLLAVEQRSGSDVAALLGQRLASVFVYRSRVQRLIQTEIERLQHDLGGR